MSEWDLVIVGGGPVGLVTAIAARQRGLSAIVVERSPGPPSKACGEGLMPGAVEVLSALGVDLSSAVELHGIRFLADGAIASGRFPDRAGRALSRERLMDALLARARGEAVPILFGHTLRDFRYDRRIVSVEASVMGGGSATLRGRLLVAADGLRSGVRRRLGYELPPRRSPRFGLSRHYRCTPWSEWVEVHWQDGAEAYVTPLGPSEVGVALLSDGAPARYDVLLARFPALQSSLRDSAPVERVRGAGPFEQRVQSVLAPGVALVGDAAGYLDAISGEGLALGFRGALALVERLAAGQLRHYPHDHARISTVYQTTTRLMLEIARRPRLRRAVIRYLAERPTLFSDLVGIAGGSLVAPASGVGATLRWALACAGLLD
jgi:flavin-dependent dehydrogenase